MQAPNLDQYSLHIWELPHSIPDSAQQDIQLLADWERARAERIRDDAAKHSYIAIHTAMRNVLASYLDLPATELLLTRTAQEKPILIPNHYPLDLRFNLSHSGEMALLAITVGMDLGIDVEQLSLQRRVLAVARRYFCEATVAALAALEGLAQKQAFLRAWTQYEAFKKAQGSGLRGDDRKLSPSLAPFPAEQFRPLFPEREQSPWLVAPLAAGEQWIGAVVIGAVQDSAASPMSEAPQITKLRYHNG